MKISVYRVSIGSFEVCNSKDAASDNFENFRKGARVNELPHSDDDRGQRGIDPLDAEQEIEFKCALLLAEVVLPYGDGQCCYAISGLSRNPLLALYLRGSRFAHLDSSKAHEGALVIGLRLEPRWTVQWPRHPIRHVTLVAREPRGYGVIFCRSPLTAYAGLMFE